MFVFNKKSFARAQKSATEQLKTVQQLLTGVKCPVIKQFSMGLCDVTMELINERIDDIPSGHSKKDKESDYIYVVGIESGAGNLAAILVEKLGEARKNASDYCRVNEKHSATHTLYVGRSKTLRSRLRQHLGANSHGIYAMHLLRWASGIDAVISVSYMKFEREDDLPIQAIEDGPWESLKPAFGRKGER
jgi:hypothetical protein